MRLSSTVVPTLAAFAALTSAAQAADRHVVPAGGVGAGECTPDARCTLAYAVAGGSDPGDRLLLASGTYPAGAGLTVGKPLTIAALDPAAARPVISGTQVDKKTLQFTADATGSALEHVEVRATGTNINAAAVVATDALRISDSVVVGAQLGAMAGSGSLVEDSRFERSGGGFNGALRLTGAQLTVRRITVRSTGGASPALVLGMDATGTASDLDVQSDGTGADISGGVTRRARIDAVVAGLGIGADALLTDSTVLARNGTAIRGSAATARLRNVTAVARGANGHGVWAPRQDNGGSDTVLTLTNVIARGDASDLRAELATAPCMIPGTCKAGRIVADHSAFVTTSGSGTVEQGAGNTAASPGFAGGDDLHLLESSPLRDAGVSGEGDGPTDVDGQPRVNGAAVDIGADEITPAPPAPAPVPAPVPAPTATPGPAPDTKAPTVTKLQRTTKALTFTADEAGIVKVTIARRTTGRRSGARCVKPTRKLRRRKACTRLTSVGSFTRTGKAGANSVAFTRKVGRRTLGAGRYRATVVVTDAAGNRSKPRSVDFTIRVVRKRR